MSLRSSIRRVLGRQNPRASNSCVSVGKASNFRDGCWSAATDGSLLLGRPIISRVLGSRAAAIDGFRTLGCLYVRTSAMRAMHCTAFSGYRHPSFLRKNLKEAVTEFNRQTSRFYPRGYGAFDSVVLWTLIGTNVIVYTMWQHLNYRFMEKHFTLSIDSVLSGRLHTILTSAFSQKDMNHLLSNMIGLYFFGAEIARNFGGRYLLTLCLAGAIGGSFGHMFYYAYIYPWLQNIPHQFYNSRYSPSALGASGVVTSVMLLDIFLYPRQTILFLLFIPMPAALMGAILIGQNLWLARQGDRDVSVGCHLGGAVVALLAFLSKRAYRF